MPPREVDNAELRAAVRAELRSAVQMVFDRVMFVLFAFAVVMLIILIGSAFMNP